MADALINLLGRKECTVQEVKSFLKSQPNISEVINEENVECDFPLLIAVKTYKQSDILMELLKHGADVNKKWQRYMRVLEGVWRFKSVEGCETHCYETIKLLLTSGADVNDKDPYLAPFIRFLKSENVLRSKIFIPILQLMIQYANNSTKNGAIYSIIISVITTDLVEVQDSLENYFQATKVILGSGALLTVQAITFFFDIALMKFSGFYSINKAQNIIRLFKVLLPYFMLRSTGDELRNSTNLIYTYYTSIRTESEEVKTINNVHITEMLDVLVYVWNSDMEEWTNMKSDLLNNNISILQVLQNSCNKSSATSEEAYEVLLIYLYARDKYPNFKDIMSNTIKNSNMAELYVLIARERFGNVYVIHPHLFDVIKEYLSKEDIFNYLLALLL